MFSRISRYRPVPDIAVIDARARVVAAKDSRPLPAVTGTFRHTVLAGDRVDALAQRYYGQPLSYWHICDANPTELSPFALVDDEPLTTTTFPLTAPAGPPPWSALRQQVSALVGVESVAVREDPVPGRPTQFVLSVAVTYNRLNVAAKDVGDAIDRSGFTAGPPADGGGLGRQIVIPPAVTG